MKLSVIFLVVFFSPNIQAATLLLYDGSLNNYQVFSLDNAAKILESNVFNAFLDTIFYAFGFGGKKDGPATTTVISAYLTSGIKNVILLNSEKEFSQGLLPYQVAYGLDIPKTGALGDKLGQVLVDLIAAGLNASSVHLVGHSIGAHLWGYAGRYAKAKGSPLRRITGLEPAGPVYKEAIHPPSLSSSDANFVDIHHTDPDNLGTDRATGSIDVWYNCEYYADNDVQPGCPKGYPDLDGSDTCARCSHDRSWRFFSKSILDPSSFMAVKADDCGSSVDDSGDSVTISVGEYTDEGARGNFYLQTSAEPVYSKAECPL